ncbi:hypothetical protein Tco_1500634 [Tanacetum coccineum]
MLPKNQRMPNKQRLPKNQRMPKKLRLPKNFAKDSFKGIDWSKFVVTKDMVDYVLAKYGNKWDVDETIADVILDDLQRTFNEPKLVKDDKGNGILNDDKRKGILNDYKGKGKGIDLYSFIHV